MLATALTMLVAAAASGSAAPSHATAAQAVQAACDDAKALLHVGLIGEAEAERVAIGADRCTFVPTADAYIQLASEDAEKARPYWRAIELQRIPRGSDAFDRALRRATRLLIWSLTLRPFDTESRAALAHVITALPAPRSRAEANALCETANQVRIAGLLPDADMIYAKALRSGHNTSCLRSGLAQIREDARTAQDSMLQAQTLERRHGVAKARAAYLVALDFDASLTDARTALSRLSPPNPRPGPLPTEREWVVHASNSVIHRISSIATWLTTNVTALVLLGIAALVVARILSWLVLLAACLGPVRTALDKLPPLRRYTRWQTTVRPFVPEAAGTTAGEVFAEYLVKPPLKPGGARDAHTTTIDRFEEPPQAPAVSFATVVGQLPSAKPLAEAITWWRETGPRRRARVSGTLLQGGLGLFGLKVTINTPKGKEIDSKAFWSGDLPGPAYTSADEEAARTALSIYAAAWAHDTLR